VQRVAGSAERGLTLEICMKFCEPAGAWYSLNVASKVYEVYVMVTYIVPLIKFRVPVTLLQNRILTMTITTDFLIVTICDLVDH